MTTQVVRRSWLEYVAISLLVAYVSILSLAYYRQPDYNGQIFLMHCKSEKGIYDYLVRHAEKGVQGE